MFSKSFWDLCEPGMKIYNFNSKRILSIYFWNNNYDSKIYIYIYIYFSEKIEFQNRL